MSDAGRSQTPEQRLEAARSWAGRPPAFEAGPGSLAPAEMTDRLHSVIAAAERAADAIRFDAVEQANRHLIEARQKADRMTAERLRVIARLTDDLIEQASVVRHHSEQMVGSLERAIETVSGRIGEATAAGAPSAPAAASRAGGPAQPAAGAGPGPSRGALPPTPILDAVLGQDDSPDRDRGPRQTPPRD
jgi:vacuolar-type H+-ATPase subunit H